MNKIENVDCFSNCTQLCKPHLSNKKIWEIYNNFSEENRMKLKSQMQEYRDDITHWEFI